MSKNRSKKLRIGLAVGAFMAIMALVVIIAYNSHLPLLRPSGWVAEQQRNLIVFTVLLSLVVIIPVYFMLYKFLTKYNESNKDKTKKYEPELDGNLGVEAVWWGVPIVLILILGVVAYKTSHSLDPFKPLESDKPALTVQVVALDWKWLFIYPEQNVVSVNYLKIPVDRPVNFRITSDAPMNAFWIPDLGGQIYAMAGMVSQINLIANKPGEYPGLSSNISGEGFADMKFVASAGSEEEFDNWVTEAKGCEQAFNQSSYDELAKPSRKLAPTSCRLGDSQIFDKVVNKYMSGHDMDGMQHNTNTGGTY